MPCAGLPACAPALFPVALHTGHWCRRGEVVGFMLRRWHAAGSPQRRRLHAMLLLAFLVAMAGMAAVVVGAAGLGTTALLRPPSLACRQIARPTQRQLGVWRAAAQAPVAAGEVLEEVQEAEGIFKELLELAQAAENDEKGVAAVVTRVDTDFARISPEDLSDLQMELAKEASDSNGFSPAKVVANAIQAALDKRMASAKDTLAELLEHNQGDVGVDIRKCLKTMENPLPLLMVLQLNIQQSISDGEEDKMRALSHIYTVINEELEKKVSRVRGLLNKLMRMDDESIRDRLLRHHLKPLEVAAPVDTDDLQPSLMAALVPPGRFAGAIAQMVGDIDRQMLAMVGNDDETRYEILDRVRTIAKEARAVIFDIYGEAEMKSFSEELLPAFRPLMAHLAERDAASGKGS
mmetsp:Transcript_26256/g.55758  ORF Transcript_26256/g.55758 Transcript_26256/m.55758 type:complete len:406 (+) Transcript_26256:73-1290(+)